jgi:NAD(P)-dependent dehydrogenase (short-subunit alcohol dehydrogenase family)
VSIFSRNAIGERRTDMDDRKETHLDVLFNSGGVMVPPIEQLTKDGYDLQFGTNVIGHGVLTLEVLPLLLEGARRYVSFHVFISTSC